jgi:hypothetical protein
MGALDKTVKDAIKDSIEAAMAKEMKAEVKVAMKQFVKDFGKEMTEDEAKSTMKKLVKMLPKEEKQVVLKSLGKPGIRDLINNGMKDEVEDLIRDTFSPSEFKTFAKDEMGVEGMAILKKCCKGILIDNLKDFSRDELKAIGMGDLRGAIHAAGKTGLKGGKMAGTFVKDFPYGKLTKYGLITLFAGATILRLETQGAGDCKKQCLTGVNDYSSAMEPPPAICPEPDKKDECKEICSTKSSPDPKKGLCSAKNRKKRGEEHCSGVKMLECATDQAVKGASGGIDFWVKWGDTIVMGIWVIIGVCTLYFIYKFITLWTRAKVVNIKRRIDTKASDLSQ